MRKEFSKTIEEIAQKNDNIIFLTGDLGFMALENIRDSIGDRFINVGVCEQNMISIAAAMASEGLLPICYSIAPFVVFRASEQIRLDVCLHKFNVKIVGNGGGYGYGIMGSTHHAIEDIAVMSSYQNIECYIPFCNEDVEQIVIEMIKSKAPSYLRLGFGNKPENLNLSVFNPIRKLSSGDKLTVIGMGPVILNAIEAINISLMSEQVDVFVISKIPILDLGLELIESIKCTGKVLFIEEHVKRGGLAEHLSILMLENGLNPRIKHLYAKGYLSGRYGSQDFHQKECGLDVRNILKELMELLND